MYCTHYYYYPIKTTVNGVYKLIIAQLMVSYMIH